MSLQFLPLMWQYHDGWRWKESKQLLTYDSNGNPILIDKSKNFYHRGHCHLFLPDYDITNAASTLAYTGTQEYNFSVQDEWGPNSNDPNQNMSIKLKGKPIWYFYIEQYWRRMYIQPYDQIDRTCKLPLNQTVIYDKYTLVEYMDKLIEENDLYVGRVVDTDWYSDNYYNNIGFNDYCTIIRRQAARVIWAELNIKNFDKDTWNDYQIVDYITSKHTITETQYDENSQPIQVTTEYDYIKNFEDFYNYQAAYYQGFVKREDAMKQFLSYHGITYEQYKQDNMGNIYIPQEETVGHIGIKHDASLACHSLGPFREGGEFYFFNTVVNRTMPCEYWLDEDKKTRQYYLKQNDCDDTTGGGTWTFKGDNSHFIWVEDKLEEAKECIDEWELGSGQFNSDDFLWGYKQQYWGYNHRKRNVNNSECNMTYDSYYWSYCYNFQNAKCTKTDKFIYDVKSGWHGNNDKVLHDELIIDENNDNNKIEHEGEKEQINNGYYDQFGWHPLEESSSSGEEIEYIPEIRWDNEKGWDGWYEFGEIIKCAKDRKWYKRTWKPTNYNLSDPYELQTRSNAPHWFYKKRQAFPNPPPWLCDDPYKQIEQEEQEEINYFSSSSEIEDKHFAIRDNVFDNAQDNRIHMLHYQYCHYYNLIRYYNNHREGKTLNYNYIEFLYEYQIPGEGDNFETRCLTNLYKPYEEKGYYRKDIPLVWEAAIDKYIEDNGEITSIAEQNIIFNNFISNLPDDKFEVYEVYGDYIYDKDDSSTINFRWYSPLYYQDYNIFLNEYGNQIPQSSINADGTYNITQGYGDEQTIIKKPLPAPIYWVNQEHSNCQNNYLNNQRTINSEIIDGKQEYWYDNEYLTYITFNEFKSIWTPLSENEINKLNLDGDYPKRKNKKPQKVPYPIPTYEDAYGKKDENPPTVKGEQEYRQKMLKELKDNALNDSASSLLFSDFFPRVDSKTREINESRSNSNPPLPPFNFSILEEIEQIPEYDLIDPYRNGKINPIDNWKKYFNKRQLYTIPRKTIVNGDYSITSPKSTPNKPFVHPREMAYSIEDGARRYYPDDKYISPIIEYQKIIRLNWERLPGYESEETFLSDSKNWRTDKNCNWGDGFDVSISIPYSINEEIQSPFSDSSKITKPIGEYCHDCIKPENQMRYHIEWYDSLEKIRKFDFPNYINLINDFQLEHLPKNMSSSSYETGKEYDEFGNEIDVVFNNTASLSLYKEDFNDYENTLKLRKEFDPETEKTWQELLEAYWIKINNENHFSENPIVRNYDCYGNEIQENTFFKLKNGKTIWRAATTYFLPTIDNVSKVQGENGEEVYGYIDSEGKIRKGGNVVTWNDPYHQNDGKWVEQCLGAIVKAKCVQILEDGFGYRWKQEVTDTAMEPQDSLKGSDYDL